MNREEAEMVLDALVSAIHGGPPSAATFIERPDEQFGDVETWLSSPRSTVDGTTPRLRSYLLAYIAIGGDRFYPTGIPLDDGEFLRPDKGVIKACLQRRLLRWIEDAPPRLELTDVGRAFLCHPNAEYPVQPVEIVRYSP